MLPEETICEALKSLSLNLGAVDYEAPAAGPLQAELRNAEGGFRPFRISDAVDSYAAIYDGLSYARYL